MRRVPNAGGRRATRITAAAPHARAGRESGRRTDPIERLERKRERLRSKYQDAVRKYEAAAHSYIGVLRLGWWALRTSDSGLALLRGDAIELCNPRWHELDASPDERERWEPVEGNGERPAFASLRDVARWEARQLPSGTPLASRISQYRRTHSRQVLEIRCEHVDSQMDVVAMLAHDVTKQVQAEAELRLAREALHHRDRLQVIGQLASGVAHDLNNALNVMRLRLELLRLQGGEGDAHVRAFAQIVDAAAARVARMHDLSRRQLDGTADLLDLRPVIEEAIALAQTQFEQRSTADGRRFRIRCEVGDLPAVRASAAELEHLFMNLLLNARDAMPAGGNISIRGGRDDRCAVITVADEGTGIPEEYRDRIFETFFTTKGAQGTGLGLAMARGTMARLGGTISARNLDRGAEFILRFPVSDDARPPPAAATVRRAPATIQKGVRTLLVDDDADCLTVTQAVLEAEGLIVATAGSGAEALEMLRRDAYDLLLCDLGMPDMSGWQVAQDARRLRPSMAICIVTGWADEFEPADPDRHGVNAILGKPLQLDELRQMISTACSRWELQEPNGQTRMVDQG